MFDLLILRLIFSLLNFTTDVVAKLKWTFLLINHALKIHHTNNINSCKPDSPSRVQLIDQTQLKILAKSEPVLRLNPLSTADEVTIT